MNDLEFATHLLKETEEMQNALNRAIPELRKDISLQNIDGRLVNGVFRIADSYVKRLNALSALQGVSNLSYYIDRLDDRVSKQAP